MTDITVKLSYTQMLELFELKDNFTLEQLKGAYKRLAVIYHPDKNKEAHVSKTFNLITTVFRKLFDLQKQKEIEKSHLKMKHEYESDVSKYRTTLPPNISIKKFDVKKFNTFFEGNKQDSPHDTGYESWLKTDPKTTKRNNMIVKRIEPEPLISSIDKSVFYELGIDKITDFGAKPSASSITSTYSDLQTAHSTQELIDEAHLKRRKDYSSVEDLQKDRANLSHSMSDSDLQRVHKLKQLEIKREALRLEKLKRADEKIDKMYQNQQMLLSSMFS